MNVVQREMIFSLIKLLTAFFFDENQNYFSKHTGIFYTKSNLNKQT